MASNKHLPQLTQTSNSTSSAPTPFLKGAHPPTNDNGQIQYLPILNNHTYSSRVSSSGQPSSGHTSTVPRFSVRAPLEAAISKPSSPSAQANLLRHLQSSLAALRPVQQTQAAVPQTPVHVSQIQQAFAQAYSASASQADRRHSVSLPAQRQRLNSLADKHRLNQIRYYQHLIAQLSSTMPAAIDGTLPTMPFEAQVGDVDKTDFSFNGSFGLNPMSAEDPSWIGHGFQAQAVEDFLSSPDWTDPSPALTDSMSFELDSCGPSPLLPLEGYEDDLGVPGIAGAPLFPQQDSSATFSPLELARTDFHGSGDFGNSQMGSDFTLFPETKNSKLPAEMAFSQLSKPSSADTSLYNALRSAALSTANVSVKSAANTTTTAGVSAASLTASPLAFSFAPAASAPVPAPVEDTANADCSGSTSPSLAPSSKPEIRGSKRRLDSTDLLPLDAPIQKRTYLSASATSRRDTAVEEEDVFAEEEAAIRREKDPRIAKRLSNTLAARRSRHRKAEELRLLHEQIDSLQNEVEVWKKRCQQAEQERDEARR